MEPDKEQLKKELAKSISEKGIEEWSAEEKQMLEDALEGLAAYDSDDHIRQSVSDINAHLTQQIRKKHQEKRSSYRRKPLYYANSIIIITVLLLLIIAYIVLQKMSR